MGLRFFLDEVGLALSKGDDFWNWVDSNKNLFKIQKQNWRVKFLQIVTPGATKGV